MFGSKKSPQWSLLLWRWNWNEISQRPRMRLHLVFATWNYVCAEMWKWIPQWYQNSSGPPEFYWHFLLVHSPSRLWQAMSWWGMEGSNTCKCKNKCFKSTCEQNKYYSPSLCLIWAGTKWRPSVSLFVCPARSSFLSLSVLSSHFSLAVLHQSCCHLLFI